MHKHELVVVANRLPVDQHVASDGTRSWVTSPGGLVTAMKSVMEDVDSAAWVGWPGLTDEAIEPFEADGMSLFPVFLTNSEVEKYYEGFSNGTLWPLYHDVIADPNFHRTWWDAYVDVNRKFAAAAASVAVRGGTVWVHDYQLQLVPEMIRAQRPDLKIGFFNHIPFPPFELFAQLPKRNLVLRGLLGADLVGFQRERDSINFMTCVRQLLGYRSAEHEIHVPGIGVEPDRTVVARAFPISIDTSVYDRLTKDPAVLKRAEEIRAELGNPKRIVLGVDRLDYTKGIRHRLKAYGELLAEGAVDPHLVTMLQVATPSRERVDAYRQLRDEVELTVGRLNGDFAPLGRPAITYMHRSFNREEMTALYMAADVLLVTSLRDGMNLVAKEYISSRVDCQGVLVLSEFTGAADELRAATLVNPHDIDELKTAILHALAMSPDEQRAAMESLRRQVENNTVQDWADDFLSVLSEGGERNSSPHIPEVRLSGETAPPLEELDESVERFMSIPRVLIASDFDGVLAPIVAHRDDAQALPDSLAALRGFADIDGVNVALVSGRTLEDLDSRTHMPSSVVLVGSHGAEVGALPRDMDASVLDGASLSMNPQRTALLQSIRRTLEKIALKFPGTEVEVKPSAAVLHTRNARGRGGVNATEAALEYARTLPDVRVTPGKAVVEFSVIPATKGEAVETLARACAADAWLYIGDDVTDESVFARAEEDDITIKVGEGDTAAQFRLESPEDVRSFLVDLSRSLRTRTGRSDS
ncbi:bifunctional alpha,alpha-trehalose-phosphate synthase (UDP-forming)/trehalose-phosphatase [Helcobacillus sp. ACRRO]|uniref:bifunctional alpha,alpha-trehalose-phosphate synthase (UDP-forming)/trehalose-phosphatase n=1 Tax=Helcobacillus TaxID=1161125 RepID=UPI001EF486F8|nr:MULTISPECIES: bifunctional alpha,alpha-trehalose-phosphate synthase (UDP-forming)/trehalose-phosphatase [Helcobacillus]MCG7426828.1 bifunctional alpha,alpha-trehalose-phosphate synthase (UDP-forming)/trehalose-phosphatase [Helcobacillus sp. ACRRO]MDK7742059.1 bifunctional alpha,alpha-trehalose-phosphate synthase (UDP-forming)/trehalose-phosphatase [Helcobacillus massiliensis]WOO93614.1 bifunctional alpha,alpha-trehalose-phosphate synthase (UDP-forming)/trehalose-phosphatase [Helcobacillus mas